MLKILQVSTVIIFAAMIVFGAGIVIAAPDRIGAYGQLVGFVLPDWLTSITAALLGRPITDAAAGLRAKLEAAKPDTATININGKDLAQTVADEVNKGTVTLGGGS
jgi:hypothetical protein